ncbi:heme oxygenase 2 [Drosophila nasuta]|uniref:heme oxygenase 2 n=1 Tax=Drosophila nasuta TaxID=42062 RepID=UPI00295E5989|nr:heme oxygenase 2 [Drosophila nasuta]
MSLDETTANMQPTENTEDNDGVDNAVDMTFTKEVRKATKDVHTLTDVLVNAKFAFALSDDEVWYDGLLVFYELYKFFETHLPERLLPKELHRTAAFERDFAYFYGSDWKKTYEPRPAVLEYLSLLESVAAKNEVLLFAYAFQMYMALMSGGQLLQKKRMIARKLWIFPKGNVEQEQKQAKADAALATDAATAANIDLDDKDLMARPMPEQVTICPVGCEATYFPTRIPKLKSKLRRIFNELYGNLNEQTRAEYIEESRNVFRQNMELLRTVKGVNRANLRKLAIAVIFVTTIYVAFKLAVK